LGDGIRVAAEQADCCNMRLVFNLLDVADVASPQFFKLVQLTCSMSLLASGREYTATLWEQGHV
jgi:hypothetical protein